MRNKILLLTILLGVVSMVSCTDETPKVTINKELAANELKSLSASDYVLLKDNEAKIFEKFQWTAPDYGFAASVTYTIQLDTAGNNFAKPVDLVTVTGPLSDSISVGDLDKRLISRGFHADQKSHVEIRVKSVVNGSIDPVYSNTQSFTVTPYSLVLPPIYIIGDVQNWLLPNAVPLISTAPGVYETTVNFQNSKKFRFFITPDWTAQQWGFSFFGAADPNLGDGADKDSNFLFNGETGTYHIIISIQNRTISFKSVSAPILYLLGNDQNWIWGNAVNLAWQGGGTFVGKATFTNGSTFRFFPVKDDWNKSVNTDTFEGGTVDASLASKNDGDKNFVFVGTTGKYIITVSTDTKKITLAPALPTTLYIMGDDQSWNGDNAVSLTSLGNGKFQGTTNFTNNSTFRFVVTAQNYWDGVQFGYNSFADGTVDNKLADTGDNASNFRFTGTTGSHTITVDLKALTVVMN